VQRVDTIMVLEDGQVVEVGSRAALAAQPTSRFAGLLRTGLDEAVQNGQKTPVESSPS
jgi:ATP-binding cassette subfamily B protein